jgi:RHS repeat-associated protein
MKTSWKHVASLLLMALLGMGVAHANTVTYIYTDPQGTPLAEANASGTITATFDYTPYGSLALGTAPNGPGYTGHVNDPDTGLVYMQARYYDPTTGRFLSVDPILPATGNAFNFSRYAYADNNPIVHTDPDGRCPLCAYGAAALGGALLGGGIDIAVQMHYHPNKPIDKTEVAIAAGGGALAAVGGAAMTAAAVRGSLTVGQAVLRQAALNGAIGATSSAAGDVAHGKPVSGQAAINAAGANIAFSFFSSGFTAIGGAFNGASENNALGMMMQAPIDAPAGIGGTIASTTLSTGPMVTAPSMLQAAASQASHLGDAAAAVTTEKLNQNTQPQQ